LDQVCRRGRRFCQDGWDINGLSLLHDDVQRMAGVAGRYGALEASQQLLALETLLGRYLADESLPDAAGNAALLTVFDKLTPESSAPAAEAPAPVARIDGGGASRAEVTPSHYWRRWVADLAAPLPPAGMESTAPAVAPTAAATAPPAAAPRPAAP